MRAPKAPPTAGTVTRTRSASRLSAPATAARSQNGACVGAHRVIPPVSASGAATATLGSIGAGATRWLTRCARSTTSHSSTFAGSPPQGCSAATLLPCSGKSMGASGASAASGSATTASGS